jgi:hypothetical protein
MPEEIEALADEFAKRVGERGYSVALVLIDPDEGASTAINTRNVSQATVCVGVLLSTILREGEPACPHCLNNYRRCEAALRTMREHRTVGQHNHSLH